MFKKALFALAAIVATTVLLKLCIEVETTTTRQPLINATRMSEALNKSVQLQKMSFPNRSDPEIYQIGNLQINMTKWSQFFKDIGELPPETPTESSTTTALHGVMFFVCFGIASITVLILFAVVC